MAIKNFLFSTAAVLIIASISTSFACDSKKEEKKVSSKGFIAGNGVEVEIGGTFDVQYGHTNQKQGFAKPSESLGELGKNSDDPLQKDDSKEVLRSGLANDTKILFSIKKKDPACDLEYGAVVKLNADVSKSSTGSRSVAERSYIYLQGKFGKFEAGSYDGASDKLRVSGDSIAKATGGIDGDWALWIPNKALYFQDNQKPARANDLFLSTPYLPYSSDYQRKSNKITYYTPQYNGFTLGISYVPDVDVKGTVSQVLQFRSGGYKNVIDTGVKYEHKFTNDIEFASSASIEVGKAKDILIDADVPNTHLTKGTSLKRKNLRAWEIGAKIARKGFIVAASYGDWGQSGAVNQVLNSDGSSGVLADIEKKDTKYWTLGTSYSVEKMGVSLTYLNSKRGLGSVANAYKFVATSPDTLGKAGYNSLKALSFGMEYKVMPGLLPYIELTKFKYDSKTPNIQGNDGSVLITGVKISF